MKAFVAKRGFVANFPKPVLGKEFDDVLVKVKAFGINRPDLIQHEADYPPPPGVTDVLGLELAGEIVEANNQELIGKEVCALVPGGAYSEYCVAKWGTCLPIPFEGEDRFIRASGLPENVFTVWKNVFRTRQNNYPKSMLFHGGSSGIGTTAIALAKAFGIEKIVITAGSDEKCKACKDLGADIAINYKSVQDWTTETGGPVDFILDMVGGDYLQQNLNSLNANGELVIIGFLHGPVAKNVNLSRILLKSLKITGSVLRANPLKEKEMYCNEIRLHIWPLLEQARIKLPAQIARVYSGVDSCAEALSFMKSSGHVGKIIVQI